jgi:hypothetical protein
MQVRRAEIRQKKRSLLVRANQQYHYSITTLKHHTHVILISNSSID